MAVYKDKKTGKWYCSVYYKDWNGDLKRKMKRGFATKREATDWERSYQAKAEGTVDLTMNEFYELYRDDVIGKIKLNTWKTKEHICTTKILPFFGEVRLTDITPLMVTKWHNIILNMRLEDGSAYKGTYVKTVHSQLSAMLNHAVKFYGLKGNPCKVTGTIGCNKGDEMQIWTKEEYQQFIEAVKDKDISYYAFQVLFWCGIRLGEMRALTKRDFDFSKNTIRINKSSQRIEGEEIVTEPKTRKSTRTLTIPEFLAEEMKAYFAKIEYFGLDDPIFPKSKSYFLHEMKRGCKKAGVKKIRIHDLRHSHVSMLIEMGFSAVDIGNRLGHESVKVTLDYAHMMPNKQVDMAKKLNEKGE